MKASTTSRNNATHSTDSLYPRWMAHAPPSPNKLGPTYPAKLTNRLPRQPPGATNVPPLASAFSSIPPIFRPASEPNTACAPSCAMTVPCLTNCQPAIGATTASATSPVSAAAAPDNVSGIWVTDDTLRTRWRRVHPRLPWRRGCEAGSERGPRQVLDGEPGLLVAGKRGRGAGHHRFGGG